MSGALPSVQERLPCALGDVDMMLGTSAGSVVAAALRCGASIEDLLAYHRGEPIGILAEVGEVQRGPWPRPPKLRFGSPKLIASALITPHRVHPTVGASAWLPVGRENHHGLRAMVQVLHSHATAQQGYLTVANGSSAAGAQKAGRPAAASHVDGLSAESTRAEGPWVPGITAGIGPSDPSANGTAMQGAGPAVPLRSLSAGCPLWIDRGQTWVVAVDYESGKRVVFGKEGAPPASLADAVVASCSVPGWYEPYVIDGRRYVDGGVRSATSLGLLAKTGVEEVWVLAPMASVVADLPREPHKRLERRVRALFTFALQREVRNLRAAGVKVTVLTPGPEDLAVMGVNLMDPRRQIAVLETSLRTSKRALADPAAA